MPASLLVDTTRRLPATGFAIVLVVAALGCAASAPEEAAGKPPESAVAAKPPTQDATTPAAASNAAPSDPEPVSEGPPISLGAIAGGVGGSLAEGAMSQAQGLAELLGLGGDPFGNDDFGGEFEDDWEEPAEFVVAGDGAPLVLLANAPTEDGYDSIEALAFAPDGETFVTAGDSVIVRTLADAAPPVELEGLLEDFNFGQEITSVAYAPSGKLLALGDSDGLCRVWSFDEGGVVLEISAHADGVTDVAFSPDGETIATVGYDPTVKLWKASDGASVAELPTDDVSHSAVAFSPDGTLLAAAGQQTLVWDVASRELKHRFGDEYSGRRFGLSFSPDSSRLASAIAAWSVDVNDTAGGEEVLSLKGHEGPCKAAAYSPDGAWIATVGEDYTICIWTAEGAPAAKFDLEYDGAVDVAWSPDSQYLVAATEEGALRVWGPESSRSMFPELLEVEEDFGPYEEEELYEEDGAFDEDGFGDVFPADESPFDEEVELAPRDADEAIAENAAPGKHGDYPREPASAWQARQAIDLAALPRFEDGKLLAGYGGSLMYETPGEIDDVFDFHLQQFLADGWTETPLEPRQSGFTMFEKDGFVVSLGVYESEPGKRNVSISSSGNFDARWLPHKDEWQLQHEFFTVVGYTTTEPILDVELFLLTAMREKGWALQERLDSASRETPDERRFDFIYNGVQAIATAMKSPAFPDGLMVQFSVTPAERSLPLPADVSVVEMETTPFSVVAVTNYAVPEVAAFYRGSLPKEGWEAVEGGSQVQEDWASMVFVQENGLLDMTLSRVDDQTLILVGDDLDRRSRIVQAITAQSDPFTEESEGDSPAEEAPTGPQAADIPLMPGAERVEWDRDQKSIAFYTGASVAEAVAFYREQLPKLGWNKEEVRILDDGFALIDLFQGDVEMTFRVTKYDDETNRVSFDGDELGWEKTLPNDGQVISYATWMRRKNLAPSLDYLDAYAEEMRAL